MRFKILKICFGRAGECMTTKSVADHAEIIIKQYYQHEKAMSDEKDPQHYTNWYKKFKGTVPESNILYNMKHGGMHVSRVAVLTKVVAAFYQKYFKTQPFTDGELIALQIAGLFHDAQRQCDYGPDNDAWEIEGASLCKRYLDSNHFSQMLSEKIYQGMIRQKKPNKFNLIHTIIKSADSIDMLRSDRSDYRCDKNPLYTSLQQRQATDISEDADAEFKAILKAHTLALIEMQDAPRYKKDGTLLYESNDQNKKYGPLFSFDGNTIDLTPPSDEIAFSVDRKYEIEFGENCYASVEAIMLKQPTLKKYFDLAAQSNTNEHHEQENTHSNLITVKHNKASWWADPDHRQLCGVASLNLVIVSGFLLIAAATAFTVTILLLAASFLFAMPLLLLAAVPFALATGGTAAAAAATIGAGVTLCGMTAFEDKKHYSGSTPMLQRFWRGTIL